MRWSNAEYDFYRDANGIYAAEFASEQESFGYWFTDELATDKHKIAEVLNIIVRLEKKEIHSTTYYESDHYILSLNPFSTWQKLPLQIENLEKVELFKHDESNHQPDAIYTQPFCICVWKKK